MVLDTDPEGVFQDAYLSPATQFRGSVLGVHCSKFGVTLVLDLRFQNILVDLFKNVVFNVNIYIDGSHTYNRQKAHNLP